MRYLAPRPVARQSDSCSTLNQRFFLSTEMITISFLLLFAYLSQEVSGIINITQPWAEHPTLYNNNMAYCAIEAEMDSFLVIGYIVIKDGLLLAEGYTAGNDMQGKYDIFSATKPWSALILGVMIDERSLRLDDTLGDIFDQPGDWEDVHQAADKQAVTVREILTHTSGLVDFFLLSFNRTLKESLDLITFDPEQKGKYSYIANWNIVSYIILRRTGVTPGQFIEKKQIFAKMGISKDDYEWNKELGVETANHGLRTNPRTVAKLSQMLMQGGLVAEGNRLVSVEWTNASTRNQLPLGQGTGSKLMDGYGYYMYTDRPDSPRENETLANVPGAFATPGIFGQVSLILPDKNLVMVTIMRDYHVSKDFFRIRYTLVQTILNNLGGLDQPISGGACPKQSFSKHVTKASEESVGWILQKGVSFFAQKTFPMLASP